MLFDYCFVLRGEEEEEGREEIWHVPRWTPIAVAAVVAVGLSW